MGRMVLPRRVPSGPLRYGIVEGLDVHDSRVHNYPPR
jgi:hypothetical protein